MDRAYLDFERLHAFNLAVSLHTLLQIFSVTVFEKIELTQAVADLTFEQNQTMSDNKLNLFDSQPDTNDAVYTCRRE